MFGDAMLVAPKLEKYGGGGSLWNSVLGSSERDANFIKVYLPPSHTWYYYFSKDIMTSSVAGEKLTKQIPMLE
jgi:alpha-glucosidase (family GH31 glycosyl hydrolase)